MTKLSHLWRAFFALGIIAIAIQQMINGDLRPVIFPPGIPKSPEFRVFVNWFLSVILAVLGAAILFSFKARRISLQLGALLLLLALVAQVPYELSMYPAHLGSWIDPLKELALSGGAFVVAGSIGGESNYPAIIRFWERLIPCGKYFFASVMLLFGISHFLYPTFVATLVPNWIPGHLFWTYFAGVALILAGAAIIFDIKTRLAGILLGVTIFIWLIVLHIPRAIADPHSGNGNEWTSVFEALAFSGIAFLIAQNKGQTKST